MTASPPPAGAEAAKTDADRFTFKWKIEDALKWEAYHRRRLAELCQTANAARVLDLIGEAAE